MLKEELKEIGIKVNGEVKVNGEMKVNGGVDVYGEMKENVGYGVKQEEVKQQEAPESESDKKEVHKQQTEQETEQQSTQLYRLEPTYERLRRLRQQHDLKMAELKKKRLQQQLVAK